MSWYIASSTLQAAKGFGGDTAGATKAPSLSPIPPQGDVSLQQLAVGQGPSHRLQAQSRIIAAICFRNTRYQVRWQGNLCFCFVLLNPVTLTKGNIWSRHFASFFAWQRSFDTQVKFTSSIQTQGPTVSRELGNTR